MSASLRCTPFTLGVALATGRGPLPAPSLPKKRRCFRRSRPGALSSEGKLVRLARDAAGTELVPTPEELAHAADERAHAADERADAAEARVRQLEEELARLRAR